jgi:hypothetical protein
MGQGGARRTHQTTNSATVLTLCFCQLRGERKVGWFEGDFILETIVLTTSFLATRCGGRGLCIRGRVDSFGAVFRGARWDGN